MFRRIRSIRTIILLSTLTAAVVGLILSYFIAIVIEQRAQVSSAQTNLKAYIASAYDAVQSTNPQRQLALLTKVNPTIGLSIDNHGRRIFLSLPPSHSGFKITQSQTQGPYSVSAFIVAEDLAPISAEITAIAGALSILIIVSGLISGTLLTRSLRRPVNEVVEAAERIAAGDLSARITPSGPEEITKLAVAFDFMAQHLEESEETKRRFLSDLAHEIATPLNSITGFALALADGTVSDATERRDAANIIASETERIKSLLNDLRNLEMLDLSYSSLPEMVNIREYLGILTQRFALLIAAKSITIKIESSRIKVNVDRRLLDMVVGNLLTNAIRYVSQGGTITLSAKIVSQRRVCITIKDDGIGIAPEHLSLIFDRLFRVDAARDRVTGGSGLGLSIAQRAALNLDGRIEVSSKVGEGSEFRFLFPERDSPKKKLAENLAVQP